MVAGTSASAFTRGQIIFTRMGGYCQRPLRRARPPEEGDLPGNETIEYDYDAESNLEKLTDVHGNVTRYQYYNDNRLYRVIVERPSQADRVFTYSYDLAGRLAQIEYPTETGIVARFDDGATPTPNPGWNANGQLTHLRYLKNGAHLHSFEYDYDDAGNRKTFIDTPQNTANATEWRYSYDWLNRLAEVKRGDGGATPVTVSLYAYDESDNRIELQLPQLDEVHTYTYNAADEIVDRSVAVGAGLPVVMETFSHDLDGNMTGRVLDPNGTPQSTFYTWSDFDRLIRIETPSATLSSSYDAGGVRKKKVGSDGVAVKSFYSGLPTASETEQSSSGTIAFSYLMAHQLIGFERNGDFFYFVTDGLSSVRLLTDSDGLEVASYVHDEFGRRIATSEIGGSSRLTYVGGLSVHDDSVGSGLLYMQQRWYEPGLGRFLSNDPIGVSGGLNLYAYAANSPVTYVDPRGLQACEWDPNNYNPYERRDEDQVLTDEQTEDAWQRWETTAAAVTLGAGLAVPDPSDLLLGGAIMALGKAKLLGRYGDVGGHHVHSKRAFKGHDCYNPRDAFAISRELMKQKGWNHQKMTNMQRELFKQVAEGKLPNTLKAHTSIAVEALVAGGASRAEARRLVAESVKNLRAQGVYFPTDIPWAPKKQ